MAWKTVEMTVDAAQVIGHRSNRMASSFVPPSARHQREFSLMGREKGEAALESAQTLGVRVLMLNQQVAALAFKQMLSASLALASIATSRTGAQAMDRQAALLRDTLSSSAVGAAKLSGSTAQLATRVMKPSHTRVKANVRRLGKR